MVACERAWRIKESDFCRRIDPTLDGIRRRDRLVAHCHPVKNTG